MKKIKALSFFTGAMGLDIGLEKSGIEIVLACESEKFIRETIKANNPKLKVLEDINKYSANDIRKAAGFKIVKDKVRHNLCLLKNFYLFWIFFQGICYLLWIFYIPKRIHY